MNKRDLWADSWALLISDFLGDPEPEIIVRPIRDEVANLARNSARTMSGTSMTFEIYPASDSAELMRYIRSAAEKSNVGMLVVAHGKETARIARSLRSKSN